MKIQSGAADLLAKRAYKSKSPTTVTFQVTDRCNYDCIHCYQEHVDHNELTFEEIDRILHELADAGVLFLTLMGGEFFMHRDANKILGLAHELGFAIKLLSTGHHIHEKRADYLATLRPLQVDMSLYGSHPRVHEQITRHPGSWQRTVDAAKRLLNRKIPVLLKAPAMESNAKDLAEIKQLADSLGADYSFDAKITAMENMDQTPVGLRMTEDTLRNFYRDTQSGTAQYIAASYETFDPKTSTLRPLNHTPCRAGQQAVSINPQGEVWPCNSLPISCGSLREKSFHEIWFGSDTLDELRDLRWAKISECNVCELRPYCQRCHGMALTEQGKMKGPSLEACRHAVAIRDSLVERGLVPNTETAMPPTWNRVDKDGQHHKVGSVGIRPKQLTVVN